MKTEGDIIEWRDDIQWALDNSTYVEYTPIELHDMQLRLSVLNEILEMGVR